MKIDKTEGKIRKANGRPIPENTQVCRSNGEAPSSHTSAPEQDKPPPQGTRKTL